MGPGNSGGAGHGNGLILTRTTSTSADNTMTIEEANSDIIQLMKTILGESYLELQVDRITVMEELDKEQTHVTCEATPTNGADKIIISGVGVGVVDALFSGMMERFAAEYPSLQSIKLNRFSLKGHLDTCNNAAGTDSKGEVRIVLANSEGELFHFSQSGRSVLGSVLCTTLRGLSYFINSERAFVSVYHALQDARQRNRQDLVQRFTGQLAILVRNTSYSEVTAKIQQELGQ